MSSIEIKVHSFPIHHTLVMYSDTFELYLNKEEFLNTTTMTELELINTVIYTEEKNISLKRLQVEFYTDEPVTYAIAYKDTLGFNKAIKGLSVPELLAKVEANEMQPYSCCIFREIDGEKLTQSEIGQILEKNYKPDMAERDNYSISEFATAINVTIQTLRNWDKSGKLKPAKTTEDGRRYYSRQQMLEFASLSKKDAKRTVYLAVESEQLLLSKLSKVREYMKIIGDNNFDVIYDTNDTFDFTKREGLKLLINDICMGKIAEVITLNKSDIANGNALNLLQCIFDMYGTKLTILNKECDANGIL